MRGAARGGRAKALSGLPGPAGRGRRSHFEFRYRQSWAADAGARLHLNFLCDSGAGHEGCSEETARHIWVTGAASRSFLKPGDVCTKNMPRAAVCCPLRGNHLRIGTRVILCVATDVPPHRAGALSPKEHGSKKAALQDLGLSPPILSPPSRALSLVTAATRWATRVAFSKSGKAPTGGRAVERIAVEPQNCAEY